MRLLVKRIMQASVMLGLVLLVGIRPGMAANKVSIGYQLMINPMKVAIADHMFEKATGYDINWVQFTAGGDAARGIAAGAVEMTVIGSVGITAAASSGIPIQLFWIVEGIGANEKLVVRDGAGIKKPEDLAGKRLAVPLGSTSQLDLYYALKNWNVKANIVNMNLQAIVAAWHRGNIDGAYVWDPALSEIEKTGHTMATSTTICDEVQVCTYDGLVVKKDWAEQHPEFMAKFVQVLNKITADYVNDPKAWTADSPMAKKIVSLNGAKAESVPKVLGNYEFPLMKEQLSEKWLGGGAAHSLEVSAKFLKQLGTVPDVLPSYKQFVTTKWVKMAMDLEKSQK